MRFSSFLIASLSALSLAYSNPSPLLNLDSAVRAPQEDYRSKISRLAQASPSGIFEFGLSGTSPVNAAVELSRLDTSVVQRWPGNADIREVFSNIRDERFMTDSSGFKRRPTWLYPDDGCYARAELMSLRLKEKGLPQGNKIFVFGNLNVNTANSPSGYVNWWYHVAVAYRIQDTIYVFDPAIEPREPLPMQVWFSKMGNAADFRIAFCSANAFTPRSACNERSGMDLSAAMYQQGMFFGDEWQRLLSLNRNPSSELGDAPPWR